MEWPTQFSNLNCIKHLYKHKNPLNGIYKRWKRVEVKWEKIAVKECQTLVKSMPKRVRAVLKAKGGYTKY
jgi:hypothetical protein